MDNSKISEQIINRVGAHQCKCSLLVGLLGLGASGSIITFWKRITILPRVRI